MGAERPLLKVQRVRAGKSEEKREEVGGIDSTTEKNEQQKSGEFFPPAEGKKRNGDERKSKPDGIKRKN
jgi:hypothetical protein